MGEPPLANHRLCTASNEARHNTSIYYFVKFTHQPNGLIMHTIRFRSTSTNDVYRNKTWI